MDKEAVDAYAASLRIRSLSGRADLGGASGWVVRYSGVASDKAGGRGDVGWGVMDRGEEQQTSVLRLGALGTSAGGVLPMLCGSLVSDTDCGSASLATNLQGLFPGRREAWERVGELAVATRQVAVAEMETRKIHWATHTAAHRASALTTAEAAKSAETAEAEGKEGKEGKEGTEGTEGKEGKAAAGESRSRVWEHLEVMLQAGLQQRHQPVHRPLLFRATRVAREVGTLGRWSSGCGPRHVPDLLLILWENAGLKAEVAADMFRRMPVRLQNTVSKLN